MFDLQTTWWEPTLRAVIIYSALLVMVRFSGRRTVGQFTPFDLLVVMLLSESVSSALNGGEESVTGGLLAAASLVAVNMLVALVTSRSAHVQALVEGSPILIGRDGELFASVLKKNRIPSSDVMQALREADCDLRDMKFAFLEADGQISILKDASADLAALSQPRV
jgi:uncharacterized membrane protein YcaP (DUF421 family)